MTDSEPAVLEACSLTKAFGAVTVIHDVSFQLSRNEVIGIVGENGAGKSTLIKMLSGVYRPDSGEVRMNGERVGLRSPLMAILHGIATVHQEMSLCENLTVAENLMIGALPKRAGFVVDRRKMLQLGAATLARLGVSVPLEAAVKDLPVLQRQLVEIAKALQKNSQVIILDEPTSALKETEKEQLYKLIRQLREHASIILISHYIQEVLDNCDRILVLRDGELVRDVDVGDAKFDQVVHDMINEEVGELYPKYNEVQRNVPAALALSDISARVEAVSISGVGLRLQPGEILGLAGLSGSGAQEVLTVLTGRAEYTGEVLIGGERVRLRSPAEALTRGLCYVPNDRKVEGLAMDLTSIENGSMSVLKYLRNWLRVLPPRAAGDNVGHQLKAVVFRGNARLPVNRLSGGNQQKVVFVKMANARLRPKILVLNDFTRGVDVGAKRDLYHVIMRSANEGVATILASSDLEELVQLCDRILLFRNGKVFRELPFGSTMREVQVAIESDPGSH